MRESTVRYKPFIVVFAQGDRCGGVMYIDRGRVKPTTTSPVGREVVVLRVEFARRELAAPAFIVRGAD